MVDVRYGGESGKENVPTYGQWNWSRSRYSMMIWIIATHYDNSTILLLTAERLNERA